jgi:hypothetical protein
MDMEFGRIKNKSTKAVIEWTENKDLEFINGSASKYIKVSSEMTFEMDTVSFPASTKLINRLYYTKAAGHKGKSGRMANLTKRK